MPWDPEIWKHLQILHPKAWVLLQRSGRPASVHCKVTSECSNLPSYWTATAQWVTCKASSFIRSMPIVACNGSTQWPPYSQHWSWSSRGRGIHEIEEHFWCWCVSFFHVMGTILSKSFRCWCVNFSMLFVSYFLNHLAVLAAKQGWL
jgi:hypothetical protein